MQDHEAAPDSPVESDEERIKRVSERLIEITQKLRFEETPLMWAVREKLIAATSTDNKQINTFVDLYIEEGQKTADLDQTYRGRLAVNVLTISLYVTCHTDEVVYRYKDSIETALTNALHQDEPIYTELQELFPYHETFSY